MKKLAKICLALSMLAASVLPAFSYQNASVEVASAATTATGYTKSSDVDYVQSGKYIANWGARDEKCKFLSPMAESFYTGSRTYDVLSRNAGSTSLSSVPSSALHKALKKVVTDAQTYQTSYGATTGMFCYTDCVSSNYSKISSFYSGKQISGTWDSGSTWNREHTWPNSKGDANGNGENDIMMLRPTSVSENSSRGNKAYGQSGGYYDPNGEGQNVRGDCARIMLYVYTRWGTSNMWGSSGVMESKEVLLKWMKEDPVDTWEMGRNDAVQSITGTRNIYVDYPEYAWMLFGEEVPSDMVTPSGLASDGVELPDGTDTPTTPDTPDVPDTPDTPDTPDEPTIPSVTSGLEEGVAYTISARNANNLLYVTGSISSGQFNCSTNAADAVSVYVENTSGGQYLYMLDGSQKLYFVFADNSSGGSTTTSKSSATVFKWNSTLNTLVVALSSNNRAFGVKADNTGSTLRPYDANNTGYNWGQFTVVDGSEPSVPDTPVVPEQPDTPVVPEQPDTPVVPDEPDTPVVPDEPDTPVVPDEPTTPDTPVTPPQQGDDACAHEYGEWFVIVPATTETEGMQSRFCELCGNEEQDVIPVLTEEETDSETDGSDSVEDSVDVDSAVNDGVAGMMAGCESGVGASMVGVALLTVSAVMFKRKKEDE